jgi:mono/diheme cytochrome c family protein
VSVRKSATAVLALAAMLSVGCKKSPPPLTEDEAAGQHLYNRSCAHCHEENDLGLRKIPPSLHHVFANQTLPSGTPATDDQVRRILLEGKGLMPPFAGRFSPVEMQQLLAWLHHGTE